MQRALLQSTALLEFYLVKNNSVTSELISKLDDVLKDISKIGGETIKIKNLDGKEKDNENVKTKQVSELFSQEEPLNDDSLIAEEVKDIFDDAPFSSYLTALPGDVGVSQKEMFSKKLIDDPKVKRNIK